jgi:hypothetical protein
MLAKKDRQATRALRHAAACGALAAFALVQSAPLLFVLRSHLPGAGAGDNLSFLWNVWWMRFALRDPDAGVFWTTHLFAPDGVSLALHTHAAGASIPAALLSHAVDIVAAQNAVILVGLMLNGVVAYALIHAIVRRALPALVGALTFAGAARLAGHLYGHFNLIHAWVLPLYALAWRRYADRPTAARAGAVGLALALTAAVDYYFAVYCVALTVAWLISTRWSATIAPRTRSAGSTRTIAVCVALLTLDAILIGVILATGGFAIDAPVRISARRIMNPLVLLWVLLAIAAAAAAPVRVRLQRRRSPDPPRVPARHLALAAAAALVPLTPLLVAALRMWAAGDYVSAPTPWWSSPAGVDLMTAVTGNPFHPLYGAAVRALYARAGIDLIEQVAWAGVVPLACAAAAVGGWRTLSPDARRWTGLAAVFVVWSLGPFLTIAGRNVGLVLPFALLRYAPVVSNARMPGRAFIAAQLCLAVVAACVLAEKRLGRSALLLVLAVAAADALASPIPLYRLPDATRVDAFLAGSRAEHGAVLELPTGIRDGFGEIGRFDHRALYFQIHHERPLVGGFVARLPRRVRETYLRNPAMRLFLALSADGPPPGDAAADEIARSLTDLGVRYVILNDDTAPAPLRDFVRAQPWLEPVLADGPRELYRVR